MFIDLHAHILPGLDDGAKNIEDSLAMAQVAKKDGINVMAATPHVIRGVFDNTKDIILRNVDSLNKSLEINGIELLVLPGAEYRLEPDLPQRLTEGDLLTINNSGCYLLIELPSTLLPKNTQQLLYEIQLQGVTPIIAHPERNMDIAKHPEIIHYFAQRGILVQITSSSITGLFGKTIQKNALKMLETGEVHVVASDGHTAHGRAPLLLDAYKEIDRRWGMHYARTLAYENPKRIINGQNIMATPAMTRQTLWSRIRSQ